MRNADYGAFPSEPDGWPKEFGLTKREYFAGLAMQGLLANGDYEGVESAAVVKADALLKELEK